MCQEHQLQGQLQTQYSVDIANHIMDKHNIKSKTNYRQALEENTLMRKSKQTNKRSNNNNNNNNNNNFINTNRNNYLEMRNGKYKYLERIIIIKLNSCLYMCKLISSEANYKVSTSM
jgi:hypothetical protein